MNEDVRTNTETPLIVDTHAHVYLRSMKLADTAWHQPPCDASIENYVATLAKNKVRYAVLAAASLYGTYSDYTLEALARFAHLRGTVIVDPNFDIGVLKDMKAKGVVGIRFQWRKSASVPDLTSAPYRRLLRHVVELDWHVHVHDDAPRLAGYLPHLEDSGVKIVVDHFGRADPAKGVNCDGFKALLASIERGRTWVKLSGAFRLESKDAALLYANALRGAGGTERLFWGSDWPFAAFEESMTYDQSLADFSYVVPDANVREAISQNALHFYFGDSHHVR